MLLLLISTTNKKQLIEALFKLAIANREIRQGFLWQYLFQLIFNLCIFYSNHQLTDKNFIVLFMYALTNSFGDSIKCVGFDSVSSVNLSGSNKIENTIFVFHQQIGKYEGFDKFFQALGLWRQKKR